MFRPPYNRCSQRLFNFRARTDQTGDGFDDAITWHYQEWTHMHQSSVTTSTDHLAHKVRPIVDTNRQKSMYCTLTCHKNCFQLWNLILRPWSAVDSTSSHNSSFSSNLRPPIASHAVVQYGLEKSTRLLSFIEIRPGNNHELSLGGFGERDGRGHNPNTEFDWFMPSHWLATNN